MWKKMQSSLAKYSIFSAQQLLISIVFDYIHHSAVINKVLNYQLPVSMKLFYYNMFIISFYTSAIWEQVGLRSKEIVMTFPYVSFINKGIDNKWMIA